MRLTDLPVEDPGLEQCLSAAATDPKRLGDLEITEALAACPSGIERFMQWADSASTRLKWDELQVAMALYGPQELPEVVAAVREALLACLTDLEGLNQRMRGEQQQATGEEWPSPLMAIAHARAVEPLNTRLDRLLTVYRCLKRDYEQSEDTQLANVVCR